jgi:hypothetical protein
MQLVGRLCRKFLGEGRKTAKTVLKTDKIKSIRNFFLRFLTDRPYCELVESHFLLKVSQHY